VKLLLDTHVWIWSQEDPDRFGPQTRRLLLGSGNENHVCTVSSLELARLVSMGAIELSIPLHEWVQKALQSIQARTVQVSHEVALNAYSLPGTFHKDPADRILAAAARHHELVLLTADRRILDYKDVLSRDARK
jgi:PIN domain nuclease of toxin-antitoxin system